MKTLLSAFLALVASAVPASAITIVTPANGAQVPSPFSLVASTGTCAGVPAVSMGYSIDSGAAIIEPTSFSASVSASTGSHTLHVKCWGAKVHAETLLSITVAKAAATSGIVVSAPASGSSVSSPFTVTASAKTCGSVPAISMGYSIDSGTAVIEPTSFSAAVSATPGAHVLHVKCWGSGVAEQSLLPINVGSSKSAATPQFSLPSGQYTSKQTVALSDVTPGSTIYYTTDGSGPSTSSPRYSGAIPVASSMVIQALATSSGYTNSGLARASYTIKTTTTSSGPSIPSTAKKISDIQTLSGWRIKHDPATGGSANGSMNLVSNPTLSGQTARYDTSYSGYGGVLYSITYGKDDVPTNFVYDAEVWIEAGSKIGNLEMDNNQVIPNGDTVIYAFQCAGDSNTWDYSENAGTRANPVVKWVHSNQPCNPQNWATNTWHHVQISYSRDSVGDVTYHSVWLDGVEAPINKTVMSAFSLRWAAADLIGNFQVDGPSAGGASTLYLDNFTIYRW